MCDIYMRYHRFFIYFRFSMCFSLALSPSLSTCCLPLYRSKHRKNINPISPPPHLSLPLLATTSCRLVQSQSYISTQPQHRKQQYLTAVIESQAPLHTIKSGDVITVHTAVVISITLSDNARSVALRVCA
jgi:hypothetical protein